MYETDITNSNSSNSSNPANTGSRPCRCVSAAVFPHRANKCKLFNTTQAGTSAVAKGAAQVGNVVANGTSRLSHMNKQSGNEERRTEQLNEQSMGKIGIVCVLKCSSCSFQFQFQLDPLQFI